MFWLLLNSVCTVSRLLFFSFLLLCSSCIQQDGRRRKSGSKLARTAHPNYAKGYFVLFDVMLSNRNDEQEVFACGSVFPYSCCLESGCTPLPGRGVTALAAAGFFPPLHLLNLLRLYQQIFSPLFSLFCPFVLPAAGEPAAPWVLSWSQPTTTLPINRPRVTYLLFLLSSNSS